MMIGSHPNLGRTIQVYREGMEATMTKEHVVHQIDVGEAIVDHGAGMMAAGGVPKSVPTSI